MGIYMHRLLPEIFDRESLHIVMSALDDGSYTIVQPLCLPPVGPPAFESAPYPQVDMTVLEDNDDDDDDVYAKEDEENDKSMTTKEEETVVVVDVDAEMEGGSRDEMVVSPFSTKGLLKLLENKGCDISEVRCVLSCVVCVVCGRWAFS